MRVFRSIAVVSVAFVAVSVALGKPPTPREQAPCLVGSKRCAALGAPAKACEISSKGCALNGLKLVRV